MYLERLQDGLADRKDELADITGIMGLALQALPTACEELKLEKAASTSVTKAEKFKRGALTIDEAAAVHLYTTNSLYAQLNKALRSDDRVQVKKYMRYIRLFLEAVNKMPTAAVQLYRGVALDLSAEYVQGSTVTWWAVSSCTSSLKVASSFGGAKKSTLFNVTARRSVGIKHLSEFQGEEEFILAPGTQFKVIKVTKKAGGLVEVDLEEIDGERRVH